MKKWLSKKEAQIFGLFALVFVTVSSQPAQAQALKTAIGNALQLQWLKALITAGIGIWALHEIVSEWQNIFSGGAGVFKTLVKIAAIIGMMLWWTDILTFLLSVGAWN